MGNRKGSILDIFYIMVVIFAVALSFIIAFYTWGEVTDGFEEVDLTNDTNINDTINTTDQMFNNIDGLFLGIYVGLLIFMLLSSFSVNMHPAFTWISIILLIIAIIVSVPLSNAYQITAATLGVESSFGITGFILSRLPIFTLLMGAVAMVVIYGKSRGEGGDMG